MPCRSWRRPNSRSGFGIRMIGLRSVAFSRWTRPFWLGRSARGSRLRFGFGPDCGAGAAGAAGVGRRCGPRRGASAAGSSAAGSSARRAPRRPARARPRRPAPPRRAPRRPRARPRRAAGSAATGSSSATGSSAGASSATGSASATGSSATGSSTGASSAASDRARHRLRRRPGVAASRLRPRRGRVDDRLLDGRLLGLLLPAGASSQPLRGPSPFPARGGRSEYVRSRASPTGAGRCCRARRWRTGSGG